MVAEVISTFGVYSFSIEILEDLYFRDKILPEQLVSGQSRPGSEVITSECREVCMIKYISLSRSSVTLG